MESRQIPGAVLLITKSNQEVYHQAFGHFQNKYGENQQIDRDTLFDIASLTKVVATTPAILFLHATKMLNVQEQVQTYIPEFRFPDVVIEHLLTHASGLPADLNRVDRHRNRDVIKEVLSTNLIYEPGKQVLYSDLGMILLGRIIERVTNQPLHIFIQQTILEPWELFQTKYLLTEEEKRKAAATERDKSSFLQGVVHDEKDVSARSSKRECRLVFHCF
ncbi:serine hydrolase domain-containing protein [Radiobacillus deserti]|uniref:serine hydrolase domain-containing protein n=1 Tax=Radiobacillus deserti TaxID=2594883 RepID=UPI0013152E98|nr:serine hydrolase domain-containing protein [Radiobacillus deserti]